MTHVLFETDWLGSAPVFYHEKTGKASHNINEVIDYADVEFDPEGLNNFLDFGYSVFEQTPVKHVKFLRHSARLLAQDDGTLTVEYLDDPVEGWLDRRCSEDEVIDLLRARVNAWERRTDGEIVIPTSAGHDSRLLNWLVEDKSRIRSFTYGVSNNQEASLEVVYARHLAQVLGTRWEQIPLGDFHRYFDAWDALYGPATHAHGMYHIEFFTLIRERVAGGNPLLSGIIGDAWAGSVEIDPLTQPADILQLGYSHGIKADSSRSLIDSERPRWTAYYEQHRKRLADPRIRVIEAMRFKTVLLSYLLAVPRSLGFVPWSPFLDIEVAMAMVNLPPERRANRQWQRELFQRHGVDFESMGLRSTTQNTLDLQAMRRIPVQPLDERVLGGLVQLDYVRWVNRQVRPHGPVWERFWALSRYGLLGRVFRKCHLQDQRMTGYCAYLTLLPLQHLLRKCDHARSSGALGSVSGVEAS
jgi:asparagine synthetase B (glutamine-hydrolysing)